MELMELEDRKEQTRKLSGGLQRRLSIAMALMSDPQILFLDEPTLGLDPLARKSVWNYIEKLKKRKTILLTTHYLEEADSLADCIAIMDEGEIIETGTPGELKQRYTSGKTLKISAGNITTEVIDILTKQGMEVILTDSGVEIKSRNLDFHSILDLFQQKNITISRIEMQEPTLNDVFLHLTGKEATV